MPSIWLSDVLILIFLITYHKREIACQIRTRNVSLDNKKNGYGVKKFVTQNPYTHKTKYMLPEN